MRRWEAEPQRLFECLEFVAVGLRGLFESIFPEESGCLRLPKPLDELRMSMRLLSACKDGSKSDI